jgi:hypothetical protein
LEALSVGAGARGKDADDYDEDDHDDVDDDAEGTDDITNTQGAWRR